MSFFVSSVRQQAGTIAQWESIRLKLGVFERSLVRNRLVSIFDHVFNLFLPSFAHFLMSRRRFCPGHLFSTPTVCFPHFHCFLPFVTSSCLRTTQPRSSPSSRKSKRYRLTRVRPTRFPTPNLRSDFFNFRRAPTTKNHFSTTCPPSLPSSSSTVKVRHWRESGRRTPLRWRRFWRARSLVFASFC